MRRISVIIVTSGVNNYLRNCLDSLKKQTYPAFETIVIDNSTNPDFSRQIAKDYLGIKLYSNPENLFYCEALNLGIKVSKGDFILCLNDDVILDKEFIAKAIRGFYIDPKIGMVSGKILRSNGRTLDSAGLFLSLWRTVKERGYGSEDIGKYEKEEYIFGVNGAVAFYRKEMLEDIKESGGYFDKDFHIFYEDLDIAWRAQRKGWQAYYIPKAIAYHVRGGTVRDRKGINKPYAYRYVNENLCFDLLKNRYLVLIKNESVLDYLLHLPFLLFYDLLVWTFVLFFRTRLIKRFILYLKYFKPLLNKKRLFYRQNITI